MAHQATGGGLGELVQTLDAPRNARHPLMLHLMDGTRQLPQPSIRILGVEIALRMSVVGHVERTCLKIVNMVRALHQSIRAVGGLTMQIRIRLAQAVCQVTLDYACPILVPLNTRASQALLRADAAIFRLVFGAPIEARMPSAAAMAQELGWLLSEHRWWKLAMRHATKQLGVQSRLGEVMRQRHEFELAFYE